jgi:arylsulfatase A-like enzyme
MKKIIIAIFVLSTCCVISAAARQPNVIVFLSDDQGWGDLSFNGNKNLSTPNVDSLARQGASFESFYVCAVCSPTRAEFLTGRYHPRGGVYSTSAGGERLDLDETTIGDIFKAAGYSTACYGKWHNGMQYPYHPNGRGFDEFYGFCSGHWGHYFDSMLEHNGDIVTGNGFCIDDFTDKGIKFIEENRDHPFFCYFAYNTPHSPMQVPDEYWNRFRGKELKMRHRDPEKEEQNHLRCALAMCENIDWNVGRVLRKLDELQLAENTIVVYFNDNGPNGWRWNGDMRGRKGAVDEGGVRSALFMRWKGAIKPGVEIRQLSSVIDLLPSLAELCGVTLQNKKPLDGRSFVRWLRNPQASTDDRLIVNNWRNRISVRSNRFRLDEKYRLYDMHSDFGQRIDIADQYPDVKRRLTQAADAYRAAVLTELPKEDKREFVIAHPGHSLTQVPARDARASGGVKRSCVHPNCSYYSNWTSTDEKIYWDVDVAAEGRFEVTLFYTCPAKDVGSSVVLSCGGSRLPFKMVEAHDPPLIGAEHDRFKRVESYVKDWKRVVIGAMNLRQGKQRLELCATEIPGSQVMDFRLLLFKRIK